MNAISPNMISLFPENLPIIYKQCWMQCSTIITIHLQFCWYLHNKGCSVICTLGELKRNKTHKHAFSSVLQSADFIDVLEEKNGGVVHSFSGEEIWTLLSLNTRNQPTATRTQTFISTESMLTQSYPQTQSVVKTECIKTPAATVLSWTCSKLSEKQSGL